VLLDLRTIINAWAYYVLQKTIRRSRRSMSIQDSDDSDIDELESPYDGTTEIWWGSLEVT
jgi:hypothetical protein